MPLYLQVSTVFTGTPRRRATSAVPSNGSNPGLLDEVIGDRPDLEQVSDRHGEPPCDPNSGERRDVPFASFDAAETGNAHPRKVSDFLQREPVFLPPQAESVIQEGVSHRLIIRLASRVDNLSWNSYARSVSSERATMPWDELVGRNLRSHRDRLGWQQEKVASAARDWGLDWDRSTVAAVERGARSVSLREAVLACRALGLELAQFFDGDELVEVTDQARAEASALRKWASGRGGQLKTFEGFQTPATGDLADFAERAKRMFKEYGPLWPEGTAGDLVEAERAAAGEAEVKAARSIDADPVALSVLAFRIWGCSLTEERERLVKEQASKDAGPRTLQAVRGHVTRTLVEELRQALTGKAVTRKSQRRKV